MKALKMVCTERLAMCAFQNFCLFFYAKKMLDETVYVSVYSGPSLIPDSELSSNVRNLNQKLSELLDIVHT